MFFALTHSAVRMQAIVLVMLCGGCRTNSRSSEQGVGDKEEAD